MIVSVKTDTRDMVTREKKRYFQDDAKFPVRKPEASRVVQTIPCVSPDFSKNLLIRENNN